MQGMYEATPIADVFCSGLGAIENLGGGCLRLYVYVLQAPIEGDGPAERVIVGKVIVPIVSVPDMVMQLMAAMGRAAWSAVPFVGDLLQ